jgi:flagellar biosynthesis/type III secretory pathway protein FliH
MMLLSKRIIKGLDQGIHWESLASSKGNPITDIIAHQELIRQREQEIIEKAQALRLKETAVEQVTTASREQGHQEGFEAGYQEGLQKALAEAALLKEVTERLHVELQGVYSRLGDKVLNLVVTACRQVVQDHSIQCPQSIVALVREAVANIAADVVYVTVAASPNTSRMLKAHLESAGHLSTRVRQSVAVQYKEDTRLADGGFMVFHTSGQMDYSLETRWANVMAALSERPQDLTY